MRFLGVLPIIAVAIIATVTASEAEAKVAVTPERHVVTLSPGETQTVEYQIYNSGKQDLSMVIDPEDWTELDIDNRPELNSWLSLPHREITVQAGGTAPLLARVVGVDDFEGEMLAMLFLCYKEDEDSAVNIRNGTPLYVVIKGTERYDAQIKEIEIKYSKSKFRKRRKCLDITATVRNTGNIHIEPDITASIVDDKGEEIERLGMVRTRILLRGQDYAYILRWSDAKLSDGRYSIVTSVNYKDKIEDVADVTEFDIKDGKLSVVERGGVVEEVSK